MDSKRGSSDVDLLQTLLGAVLVGGTQLGVMP